MALGAVTQHWLHADPERKIAAEAALSGWVPNDRSTVWLADRVCTGVDNHAIAGEPAGSNNALVNLI